MMSPDPNKPISAGSNLGLARWNLIERLVAKGYVLIPLAKGGKRPLLKWKRWQDQHPGKDTIRNWFGYYSEADVGLLTSPQSGIICLDCDAPPYPDHGYYTQTPSGGRHYWYRKHSDDLHGIGITPKHDVPWIVKIYDTPIINEGRIPISPIRQEKKTPKTTLPVVVDTTIPYEAFNNCEFIKWYHIQKLNPLWDGRYPLARAYASNIQNSDAPPDVLELGPNYRHEAEIYRTVARPITCSQIYIAGYKCRYLNKRTQCCNKDRKSRSPYGLAANLKDKP